ncbi:TPR end-of-group domain-containing protein [Thalassolituus oleivorans]|uniref:TPR end-of-group domain-containing protein n=1 Tax=Thalassolituus oleivorans TaxID=187493 RepID=UPI0030C7CDAE
MGSRTNSVIKVALHLMLSMLLFVSALVLLPTRAHAEPVNGQAEAITHEQSVAKAEDTINSLQAPLYSAFTERYLLDEVKNLRQMIADTHLELTEKVVDRELGVADKALAYATDTVTYFFYLIAGASTLLVLVGWNSLREIKDRVGTLANEEIKRITDSYEARLDKLERELHHKSRHIAATQEEIELTNEVHSLWLKASQEASPQSKIAIYDQILEVRPDDLEALTYKADAALGMGQTQWATSLANRALSIDPDNSHALYQRACAHAESGYVDEALRDLESAIGQSETLREQAGMDASFESLQDLPLFKQLVVTRE